MKMLNILKPDILQNKESLHFYLKELEELSDVSCVEFYKINNWDIISKYIYELDVIRECQNEKEKNLRRKQPLTIIKGYNEIYPDKCAVAVLMSIHRDRTIRDLYLLKKEVRKRFVENTDLYYLKFCNLTFEQLSQPLPFILSSSLSVDIKKFPFHSPYDKPSYKMIFFNQIPCPDYEDIQNIENELEILLSQKNKVSFNI